MKRQYIPLVVLIIILSGNLLRTNAFQTIRTVDILQLVALGILLGILLAKVIAGKRSS